MVQTLKQKANLICLTADGMVPLNVACPSSLEALLGLAGLVYKQWCGGGHRWLAQELWRHGSFVCGQGRASAGTQCRSLASPLPCGRSNIELAIEACPSEDALTILTALAQCDWWRWFRDKALHCRSTVTAYDSCCCTCWAADAPSVNRGVLNLSKIF
jgi:hypothetical protein